MGIYQHRVDLAMDGMPDCDMGYQMKTKKVGEFRKTFPKKYVEYAEAEPETMQFDQTLATDKAKQAEIAKEFITRNRHRMWMFHVDYVKKTHRNVLHSMLEAENFPGLMDELTMKERKFDRGSGSEAVQSCLTMSARLISPDFVHDEWLTTMQRTSREKRMNAMYGTTRAGRITENNRISCFKGF
jgi:hypothetical protein